MAALFRVNQNTFCHPTARQVGLRRGGIGEVFVARDTELGREVALKEIQLDKSHDSDARARFTREAEITGGLEHPGIVPVYGLGKGGLGKGDILLIDGFALAR